MSVAVADLAAAAGHGLLEIVDRRSGVVDGRIDGCTLDSRRAGPGVAFAAVPGTRVDGADFAAAAVASGSPVVITPRRLDVDAVQIVVDDVRRRLGPIAAVVYGRPADQLDVIGVTGTNGKTSVAELSRDILGAAGRRVSVMGTLTGALTTAEAPDLQASLAASRVGHDTAVLEVSSHALEQYRVDGTDMACTVFTNLGRDHLDFHGDLASYEAAKARLFTDGFAPSAVINRDDPAGRRIADQARSAGVEVVEYGLDDVGELESRGARSRFRWQGHEVTLHLVGRHNVVNALAAATVGLVLGLDSADLADGIGRVSPVRGRMELVERGQPFTVVVDYAHKPQALEAALLAGRDMIDPGARLIVVFGCGGDRDRGKRPEMGALAERLADRVVLTDDNPRTEDRRRIIDEIAAGMTDAAAATIVNDRAEAIAAALGLAEPGDLVLIAGKGHETYQIVGDEQFDFDDRLVAYEVLAGRDPSGLRDGETPAP